MNKTIEQAEDYNFYPVFAQVHHDVHNRTLTALNKVRRILVVDDNESIIDLLSVLLLDEGSVSTAINGLDALSKFASESFDLVVSDIEMPLMNGVELYKYVTGFNPKYKNRFLFFSGTMNTKFMDFLTKNNLMLLRKPGDIQQLRDIVHQKLVSQSME